MSDLLSPILLLMEDEVDTFWCFCGLMDREANNFEIMQHSMQRQLENLSALTKYFYPQFHQYLGKNCLCFDLRTIVNTLGFQIDVPFCILWLSYNDILSSRKM